MKFTDINPKEPGSEDIFLRLLQKKIDPSFQITGRKKAEIYGTKKIFQTVRYQAVKGPKILEINLVVSKGRLNHIWLSRKNVETFYGLRFKHKFAKIDMKKMDFIIPILKEFLNQGIVDERIFDKITGWRVDDWPAEITYAKSFKLSERYDRAVA